jgi:hypothetical protein
MEDQLDLGLAPPVEIEPVLEEEGGSETEAG